jgi:hypothetical protein
MRIIAVAGALAALALTPASAAATVTFGADLSLTPDLSFRCQLPPPFFGPYVLPDTCTAFTAGIFGGGGRGSHLVPNGSGVITKLRIREPNVQSSPLKLTVVRAIRAPQSTVAVCCTITSESPPFTPLPNAITEVTFNPPIPVHAITTVTGVFEYDAVALTATDVNSIIPAATAAGHSSGAYIPAAVPGQERHEDMTSLGTSTQILFEVDEELTDTSNPAPGSTPVAPVAPITVAPAPGPAIPPATNPFARPLTFGTGRFAGNAASIPLVCQLTTVCQGTLRLQDAKPPARTAKASAPRLYGSARFSVKAGRHATVKVKLNTAGRHLFATHSSITLYANTTIGLNVASAKVTIRKKKPSPRPSPR